MSQAVKAKLCRDCASGLGAKECVLCGDPLRNGPVPAYLCSTCSYGDGKNRCAKCGKPALSTSAPTAMICSFCAASLSKRQSCARCGRHINILQSMGT